MSPGRRRAVVTGLGLVTPLGVGTGRNWSKLLASYSGLRKLEADDFCPEERHTISQLPSRVVAAVPQEEILSCSWAPPPDDRRMGSFSYYALTAATEAIRDSGWRHEDMGQRAGTAIGVGLSSTTEIARAARHIHEDKLRRISPYLVPKLLGNMAGGLVSMAFGLRGPCHSAATACASGLHSIGDAARIIQAGDADVMVAGGSESCIDAIAYAGFTRLRALSTRSNHDPAAASRPFDAERDGFVLGEGAGIMMLEELEHALERGARIYAEVAGYGMSGDAHHMTEPSPDGSGAALCMSRALRDAGLSGDEVAYLNAHATSTPKGDEVEMCAIRSVFGATDLESESASGKLRVSSTKGATGHLLGAAGAVEAVFTVLALRDRMAPPTLNLENPDPDVLGDWLVGPVAAPLPEHSEHAMCNSFGFGGTNACIVFSRSPANAATPRQA